jgi:hypothetical protein
MTQHFRRGVPRQPADWYGFYRFDNVEHEPSRPCRIIDVSTLGAGLELYDIAEGEQMDGLLTVNLELSGEVQSIILNENNGTARVGATFPNPTEAALQYVAALHEIRSLW